MIEYINDLVGSGLCSNAETILSFIEDLGMLPPKSTKYIDCNGEGHLVNEWDEEDSK
jgi:hypothetical protein